MQFIFEGRLEPKWARLYSSVGKLLCLRRYLGRLVSLLRASQIILVEGRPQSCMLHQSAPGIFSRKLSIGNILNICQLLCSGIHYISLNLANSPFISSLMQHYICTSGTNVPSSSSSTSSDFSESSLSFNSSKIVRLIHCRAFST